MSRTRSAGSGTYGPEAGNTKNWATDKPYPYPHYENIFHLPGPADDVRFAGPTTPNCNLIETGMSITFKSLSLVDGYAATVTTRHATVQTLTVETGTINPYGSELGNLTATSTFTWTGGTLNATSYSGSVTVEGGTATITPPAAGLDTGHSLRFTVNAQGVGAQAAANPGTVRFSNSAGAVIGGPAQLLTRKAKLTIDGNVTFQRLAGVGELTVYGTGEVHVTGPGTRTIQLPLVVIAGEFFVEGGATAAFTGQMIGEGVSIFMSEAAGGVISIQAGSVLRGDHGVELNGGSLRTKSGAGATQTATLDTPKLTNAGAEVAINTDTNHTAGKLHCKGEVEWTGGTYRPVVNAGANTADLWYSDGKFTVGGAAKLAPGTVNGVPQQNASFKILWSLVEIVGPPLVPDSPVVGYQTTRAGNPVNEWFLRKT